MEHTDGALERILNSPDSMQKIAELAQSLKAEMQPTSREPAEIDNSPAEAIITVHVKRVTKVTLHKKSEELLNPNDNLPGKLEVVQGSTVTLGGTVTGVELGKKCNSCGEDPTGDKYLTDWKVVSGLILFINTSLLFT